MFDDIGRDWTFIPGGHPCDCLHHFEVLALVEADWRN